VLPKRDVAIVRSYCEQRVPPEASRQVRVELEEGREALTIVERRAPWREDFGPEWTTQSVARMRWTMRTGAWTLYWCGADARWHRYDLSEPAADIRVLLDELDNDPTGIFWG